MQQLLRYLWIMQLAGWRMGMGRKAGKLEQGHRPNQGNKAIGFGLRCVCPVQRAGVYP